MSGADIKAVADGLTKAQRLDLLRAVDGHWWCADGRTSKGMQRKGLIGTLGYGDFADLTPLGLAVRAHLRDHPDPNPQPSPQDHVP